MITAENITDEQLQALWTEGVIDDPDYFVATAQIMLLDHGRRREDVRARCAEILNMWNARST